MCYNTFLEGDSMYSLFIDTHSKIINIVLYQNGKVLKSKHEKTTKSHSSFIMPLIKEIIEEVKITKNDIKELIVVNGPGSFTGSRLGITIAKTWAYCKKINIKVISSLEVLAVSVKDNKKVAIADPKGYYIGSFNQNNQLEKNYQYVTSIDQDYILEEQVNIDYNLVYKYTKTLDIVNPHTIKPLYIKKIEVEK